VPSPDSLFLIAGRVAIGGWLLLAAGLLLPRRWSVPLLLAATLMFGPAGLLLSLLLSMATRSWARPAGVAA
jgi:hypothetical protein